MSFTLFSQEQAEQIKKEIESSEQPLIFYHDDADGVCSFLQFYKHIGKGKGVMVKSTPNVDERFYETVKKYSPDKIFAVDLALMTQEFIDKFNIPIVWIDHHDITDTKGTRYFNPKQNDPKAITSVSALAYDVFKEHFWLGAVGSVGDWQLPDFIREGLLKEYPDLFDQKITTPQDALFASRIGELAMILNFMLKGDLKDAHKAVEVLSQIDDPRDILEEKTDEGKLVMDRARLVMDRYNALLENARNQAKADDPVLVFSYEDGKTSLSGELSNALLYHFPEKIIVVSRKHNGQMKTSFRSGKNLNVKDLLEPAMAGINGRFGGHAKACGGCVDEKDWSTFIEQLRNQL